jgi:DNA polymerase III subunit gamma/tau
MTHISLYRKYRSQNFSELVEQESVVKTLRNAIIFERISQAYIFAGPRGTGKTSVARIFAKALNCLNIDSKNPEPCNVCDNCKQITAGTHMDVLEIDAASNTGVDNIRDLIEKSNFLPSVGKWKIYIIDETHMLSTAAFNALLKTIEEPPKHVIFILATTDPHKILPTIQSRCQRLDFSKISQSSIVKRIKHILLEEKMEIAEEAILLISKYSGGHMRDALSITDQVLSFSDGKVEVDDIYQILGTANIEDTYNIIYLLKTEKIKEYFVLMDKLFYEGLDPVLLVEDILEFFRQILFLKIGLKDMVIATSISMKYFEEIAKMITLQEIYPIIADISGSISQIKYMEDSRIFLEVLFFQTITNRKVSESETNVTPQIVVANIEKKVNKPKIENKTVNTNNITEEPMKEAFPKEVIRPDIDLDIVNVKHYWSDVLAYLKKNKKAQLSAMLKECTPSTIIDNKINTIIDPKFSFHYKKLNEEENKKEINKTASIIFNRQITVNVDYNDKDNMPVDLENDKFEVNSFLNDPEIPEDVKNVAKDFEAVDIEKV